MQLHVVTLTQSWPTDTDDADGCFVSEPLDWLAKSGVRNTVLAVRPIYRRKPQSDDSRVPGEWIRYLSLPGRQGIPINGALLFARIVGWLRELHRSERVHLIHAHEALPCGHAAMLLSKELNVPNIVTVYGQNDSSAEQVPGRMGEWCHRITSHIFTDSRRVVCTSEHVREKVLERINQEFRTSVVYYGVDSEWFSSALGPSEAATTVLSAGNLRAIEEHDILIRATAALVKEFPSISLEIIGDGPERSHLERLAKKIGLAGQVRFVGCQSRRQIADDMKSCSFLRFPAGMSGRDTCMCRRCRVARP